ncbi:wiskott-Aldrich syndrome protein-like isoform X2 [Sorghum bicolor]|uniref:wiskott-Aldrich syndrome protein-like isoform X2 n=1 Tax=Sorghum bicolor TaxID=4558 RepID=UPI000B424A32|nr:wiskott-Aldrich syndrome protein-like isoform X2 [Sorghum bicolor]|eukprot:XP_021314513.1 wiskott-Aldrich syndrome protein-like isoform X2 [Sorghum bicolor]
MQACTAEPPPNSFLTPCQAPALNALCHRWQEAAGRGLLRHRRLEDVRRAPPRQQPGEAPPLTPSRPVVTPAAGRVGPQPAASLARGGAVPDPIVPSAAGRGRPRPAAMPAPGGACPRSAAPPMNGAMPLDGGGVGPRPVAPASAPHDVPQAKGVARSRSAGPPDGIRLSTTRSRQRAAGVAVIWEPPGLTADPHSPPMPIRCGGNGMEVRRQLLSDFEECEDGQRDGCAMDGAASPFDEAEAIHGGREGMENRDIGDTGCEENLFFDLGAGDDSKSEDGDDSRLDDADTSMNTSCPLKGNHSGGGEANYGKVTRTRKWMSSGA